MTFTTSLAWKHFLELSHDEKVIKVIAIADNLRESSPLFADLYEVISRKDFTMSEQELHIYYNVVMSYISTMDSLQTTIQKARLEHSQQLQIAEKTEQAGADGILSAL